ncbi:DNA-binding transcriptional LysR family regulator [Rhodopseudomonas rhenobacensis]|uniref:DNA-binding transcriptional LysR family regulator n=1 Tax=Rhodopseudomonas rhenobacensis TaxID=87461 RepID=A0A7W7Z1W7_9BRAD|nr:LysR family transcriptional regulator [Rhodopseudomonas rhenobacensis]MBB5046447.1 DNA-binding transcriptional LysR family regulator [Rhodopseudomonas rhenobacensis]
MMSDALTLDQIQLLLAVVDHGSFSGAARKLNRAQSAVTYGIQKLEAQLGVALFDRSSYRPSLTDAGRALLPRARRIVEETAALRDQAQGLAGGLEAELTVVIDAMFPMPRLVEALRAFTAKFPTVPPRIYVQSMGAGAEFVLNGTCMIGLLPLVFSDTAGLQHVPLLTVQLLPVVAQDHPLAQLDGPIPTDVIRRHLQLVLTDRSALTEGRDYGVLSSQTWRVADLGTKHAMLLAGLGWGSMPTHLVADDVRDGRLKVIHPAEFDARTAHLVMGAAHLASRPLGPAALWMMQHFSETAAEEAGSAAS